MAETREWWAREAAALGTDRKGLEKQRAALVCDICGAAPCANPTFCAQAHAADQQHAHINGHGRQAARKNTGSAAEPPPPKPPKAQHDWRKRMTEMKEVQTMTFDPLKFLVPGLIPAEGVTLISSKPKVGKSWLLLDLALSATMGRYTLGNPNAAHGGEHLKAAQGDVLYLALEDSLRRLQSRMTKLLPTLTAKWPETLAVSTVWRRLDEGGLQDLREWVEETRQKGHRVAFIAIDVLKMVRPHSKPGKTPYDLDYEAIAGLRQLANDLHVAILVTHHNRKAGSDDLIDLVSATLGLTGAVDAIIVIDRQGQGFVFDVRGRDVEPDTLAAEFNKNTCRWALLGTAAVMHMSSERKKILSALNEADEPLGPNDISIATGLKAENVRYHLPKLMKDGAVEKVGYGKYRYVDHSQSHTTAHTQYNSLM